LRQLDKLPARSRFGFEEAFNKKAKSVPQGGERG
jgi:hypothetical protein